MSDEVQYHHEPKPKMAATPTMQKVGLSWVDVSQQATHVVHLLQTHGDSAIALVGGILKLIKLATARDMLGVFAQLNQTTVDVQALVAAIKAEFGVEG